VEVSAPSASFDDKQLLVAIPTQKFVQNVVYFFLFSYIESGSKSAIHAMYIDT
jgi:hypothetical protein